MSEDTATTWVVIADSRQAQFYVLTAEGNFTPIPGNWQMRREEALPILEPVIAGMFTAPPANDDQPLQRGSRHTKSKARERRLTEVPDDTSDTDRKEFAARIAQFLDEAYQEEAFTQLIVAAPPAMLTSLTATFSTDVSDSIQQTVDKDLTNLASRDLQEQFDELTPA